MYACRASHLKAKRDQIGRGAPVDHPYLSQGFSPRTIAVASAARFLSFQRLSSRSAASKIKKKIRAFHFPDP